MRRVICDVLIVITTIAPPDADPSGGNRWCLPTAPQPPPIVDSATAQTQQQTHASAERWVIYQEFIFVHCQRDPNGDDNVIDSTQNYGDGR